MKIANVILPFREPQTAWDINTENGKVCIALPAQSSDINTVSPSPPRLLLPALCHPHIHLDKAYILTGNHRSNPACPDYSDLNPTSGSFQEALSNTSKAKERYTADDLHLRGSQLLATSYRQGVTALRAFVELDHVTGTLALEAAIRLKAEFSGLIHVQICAFAQDPVFSTDHGAKNLSIMTHALETFSESIEVLGTTPYVEQSREASLRNIEWAITAALHHNLHLDFHLDYNTSQPSSSQPLTWSVIELLEKNEWNQQAHRSKTIALGHCTQLSTLQLDDLKRLAQAVVSSELPIHFVGLPTSDLFMMGRPDDTTESPHSRPRGTLQVPAMIGLGLSACLGVNNIGNAFTPYGTGDPLQLASWGVGLYQAGTLEDARVLYECVSSRARRAIGLEGISDVWDISEGSRPPPALLVENETNIDLPASSTRKMPEILARQRVSLRDVVWDPPEVGLRSIVHF